MPLTETVTVALTRLWQITFRHPYNTLIQHLCHFLHSFLYYKYEYGEVDRRERD